MTTDKIAKKENKYRPENFKPYPPVGEITQEEAKARLFAGLRTKAQQESEGRDA